MCERGELYVRGEGSEGQSEVACEREASVTGVCVYVCVCKSV